ncbi:MAG TPA: CoA transferase, partial [Candidatus Binataceae bacterium]|nr:CoA transferase [Candidatus Binataceae bacterium]
NLCRALGCEEFIEDQQNKQRWDAMQARFAEVFKTRTRDEWFDHLTKSDICVGRMLTLDELADDPQIRARNMIVEVATPSGEKVKQVGVSLKFSDTPGSIRSTAPALGQHTDEILADLGYSAEIIVRSREEGAIR